MNWENNKKQQEWCENHLCSICQYSSWLIYKAGDILAYDVMRRFNIHSWMDICITCTNKMNNDMLEEEDVRMEEDVYYILNSFIDEDMDMDAPFGPLQHSVTGEIFYLG